MSRAASDSSTAVLNIAPREPAPDAAAAAGFMQDTTIPGEVCSGIDDDELYPNEQAELEAQLRMQSILDLLEKMPNVYIKSFLRELDVALPHPDAKTKKLELVCTALDRLHRLLHDGDDLAGLYAAACSLVDDVVAAGDMDSPWAPASTEPPTLADIHRRLESLVNQFIPAEIELVLAALSCDCLLIVQNQAVFADEDDVRDALLDHLQHRLVDEKDLSTEEKIIRELRRSMLEESDSESDSESGESDWEPLRSLPQKSKRRATPKQPLQSLTREQNLDLIKQLEANLGALPKRLVVSVCHDHALHQSVFGGKALPATKEKLVELMGKRLRKQASPGTAISSTARKLEEATQRHSKKLLQRSLVQTLRPRGRPLHDSKRVKTIAAEVAQDAAARAASDSSSSSDDEAGDHYVGESCEFGW
ncbi:hypothetical protein AURDEDRAFT_175110 [Auricularia subglabra TFB-10046 SS5]|uniref:Uncharacterized protein n=1 Tax=Auricularia subglabra (strain TFB-10046 / SS5) TaxID=717982 RepID=J0CXX0_AURST|nr:hypothetical protein AURDEDRAFT_175110 [Auricularia subglabra TFB-10046 SS5]